MRDGITQDDYVRAIESAYLEADLQVRIPRAGGDPDSLGKDAREARKAGPPPSRGTRRRDHVRNSLIVIPDTGKAREPESRGCEYGVRNPWVPACAGMTIKGIVGCILMHHATTRCIKMHPTHHRRPPDDKHS
ncbi:MAG: hypothetical protein Q8R82_14085 [Hyphomonadaceae bacterium]|nr:hypothetical protein [Hyphomonadaceae bacterium]